MSNSPDQHSSSSLMSSATHRWFRRISLFIYELAKKWMIFTHQNLISNWLTYLVHAKSTGDFLISFGFSNRLDRSLVSAKRSANRSDQKKKNDFTFWLIFGLSPNLGLSETLSERLIQKVKWPNVAV